MVPTAKTNSNFSCSLENEAEYKRLLAGAQRMLADHKAETSDLKPQPEELPRKFGSYTLVRQIGQGGMGRVYLATQEAADRKVALKIVRPDLANEWTPAKQGIVSRFRSEARTAAKINHENIVPVFDVGQVEGCHYYSMRYIEGQSLAQILSDGPLADQRVAAMMESIADAVQCSHQANVLHRDLKPANILIDESGRPFVADFGLAKSGDAGTMMTRTGAILGTVEFMSPEQAHDPRNVTEKSDVYSLGAVMYAMLVGKPPFLAATQIETIKQLYDSEAVPPRKLNPSIARDLNTICLKCLAKNPGERYLSALELKSDLARFQNNEPILAKPVGLVGRCSKWAARNKPFAALLALLILSIPASLLATSVAKDRSLDTQVDYLIQSAWSSDLDKLPAISAKLQGFGSRSSERLAAAPVDNDPDREFRRAYLLSQSDPQFLSGLSDRLGHLDPKELSLVKSAFEIHDQLAISELVAEIKDQRISDNRAFQICCVIAGSTADDREFWNEKADGIANRLMIQSPANLIVFAELVKPISGYLSNSFFARLTDARTATDKLVSSAILCEFYENDPGELLNLLERIDRQNLSVVIEKLKLHPQFVRSNLESKVAIDELESLAEIESRIRLGVASWAVNANDEIVDNVVQSRNPDASSLLVHSVRPAGIDAEVILQKLERSNRNGSRYILLLALGEYDVRLFSSAFLNLARPRLNECFCHTHASVHAAAKWVLQQWELTSPEITRLEGLPAHSLPSKLQWYREKNGHEFTRVDPPESLVMGSPVDESGRNGNESLFQTEGAPFYIASKEVTVSQFRKSGIAMAHDLEVGPFDDCPVNNVSIYDAMKYCNWLNAQTGVPIEQWCYRFDEKGSLVSDFPDLALSGYRLPTEAEWEFACRAGTSTPSHFGVSRELVGKYAWFIENSDNASHEVGLLKPNQYGLFDTLGNLKEWCHQIRVGGYDNPAMRGAGFAYGAKAHRSAWGTNSSGADPKSKTGFRIARTVVGK